MADNESIPVVDETSSQVDPVSAHVAPIQVPIPAVEAADSAEVREGSVLVYTRGDSGLDLTNGLELRPGREYKVGEDLPVELGARLVADRRMELK